MKAEANMKLIEHAMERCGCEEPEAREYLRMYLPELAEDSNVELLVDYNDVHRPGGGDHGQLYSVGEVGWVLRIGTLHWIEDRGSVEG